MITYTGLGNNGRLGNQLWEIASTLGIAATMCEEVVLPEWDYSRFFSLPPELWGNPHGTESYEYAQHLDVQGRTYLQDYSLFQPIEERIRDYFKPSPLALETLLTYQDFWELEPPICALHVRRGDNAHDPGVPDKENYHPLRPLTYYEDALRELDFGSLAVFSDDIEWCKDHIFMAQYYHEGQARKKEHERGYKTDPFSDWIDLFLMAYCDQHIISNSTYSWWGAFLSGDPSPIYPWPWFGPKLRSIDASLMFPPGWRRLDHAH